MNVLASECSSGCESGWTLYLQQSNNSNGANKSMQYDDDEDEDLSMVSDASSGPPQFNEDDEIYFNKSVTMQPKISDKRQKIKQQNIPSFLDDTASSPAFNFSKHTLDNNHPPVESVSRYSPDFSAVRFEVDSFKSRGALQDQFGFSLSGKKIQENQLGNCVFRHQ